MRYRTINESAAHETWAGVITESTGVTDAGKLQWMANFLQINENMLMLEAGGNINESYGSQGPEAVPGMGSVAWPGVGKAHGDIVAPGYTKGSGDMPSRQLALAMNVAAYTIGLELLPVIPMEFPSLMFGYLDHVYAGNLGRTQAQQDETDIFIQLSGAAAGYSTGRYTDLAAGDKVVLGQIPDTLNTALAGKNISNVLYGTYIGKHRVNGNPIIKFEGLVTLTGAGTDAAVRTYAISAASDGTPASALKINAPAGWSWALLKGTAGASTETVIDAADVLLADGQFVSGVAGAASRDLVSAVDMHIPEFSKPGADYSGNENYTADRATGEKGTQNVVSLRTFSTSVEAGTVEVLAELTRTQLKDLAAYGQDGMTQLYKAAQNELTQTMNADILRTMFRLGVTSASKLKNAQAIDLNLLIGDPGTVTTAALSTFGIREFMDINGVSRVNEFGAVKNAESNSSAENNMTRARRILTRILAASNVIGTIGRHGAGDVVVTNMTVATAIQDIKGFAASPFENTLTLDKRNLYSIGTIQGGIKVYVDPLMSFNDNRILVARKGDEMSPGLKLFVYTLGESVETVSEVSMAPKVLVSSRYALTPCGFHPETQYFTFAVNNLYGLV